MYYHSQGAKLKTSLDNSEKVVSKWVIIKYFFWGGWGGGHEEQEWD